MDRKPELGGAVGPGLGEGEVSMVGVAERRGPEKEINPVDTSVRGKHRKRTSAGEVQKGRGVGVGREI